jgi:hypothetical protein
VKFNRIFGNILLIYDSAQKSVISSPIKISFKIIALNRHKEVLSEILIKIEEITDLKSLLIAKKYNMRTEVSRRECVSCKINGRAFREARQIDADLINIEFAKTVNIHCSQCNIYLCRKRKCWERYHNSRKIF